MDYDSEFYDGLYDNNNDDKKYLLALSQSDQYKEPLIKKDQYDPLDIVLFQNTLIRKIQYFMMKIEDHFL